MDSSQLISEDHYVTEEHQSLSDEEHYVSDEMKRHIKLAVIDATSTFRNKLDKIEKRVNDMESIVGYLRTK